MGTVLIPIQSNIFCPNFGGHFTFGRRRFLLFAFVVEYDLGFEKVVVIIADLYLLPFRLAARIIDGLKFAAIIERRTADGSNGVGDDDACKTATGERRPADGSDGVGDGDVCKVVAILERAMCNDLCSRFDDIFAGKRGFGIDQILSNVKDAVFPVVLIVVICGTGERPTADGSDGVGDDNACKAVAFKESLIAYGCDGETVILGRDDDVCIGAAADAGDCVGSVVAV